MANIEQIIEDIADSTKIRTGKEMRAKLYEFAKQIYEDASKNGNANMEVSEARGSFSTLNNRLNNSDSVKADKTEVEEEIAARINKDIDLQSQINAEKSRIDQFTSLPEGSTIGDAELQDIRIAADGTAHASAGTSVRTQISEETEATNNMNFVSLNQKINTIDLKNSNYITLNINKNADIQGNYNDITINNFSTYLTDNENVDITNPIQIKHKNRS